MVMKKFIVFLAAAACAIALSGCDEVKISEKRLPDTARTFIRDNFPHTGVLMAEREKDDGEKQYNVKLEDGTEMEFDAKGNWKSILSRLLQAQPCRERTSNWCSMPSENS